MLTQSETKPLEVKSYFLTTEGLSNAQVLRLREEEGFNELPLSKQKKYFHFALELFREPMVFLLMGCGIIYLFLGDTQEAIMLLSFLFIIFGITIYQERKAERALEALRDLSSPRALVLREGRKHRIPGRELVRTDTIFVNEGDRIPADGVLVSGTNLFADESLLTGESTPVEKSASAPSRNDGELFNRLYAGTTIVRGQGIMVVEAIGAKTEIGRIGKSIQLTRQEPTRLELQTAHSVRVFAWIAASLCVLLVIVYGLTRGHWLQGVLAGLTLAMAILPNELPAVLTIFLALGAWRLSRRRVLTRKMSAVENLGSATVLCVDKTGTLTVNRMSIQRLYVNDEVLELGDPIITALPEKFHELLEFGILASQKDPFDPMEKAFLTAGNIYLRGTEHLHTDWELKKEYPLSTELLSISHAWKATQGEYVIGSKGAPEAIIDLCHLDEIEAKKIIRQVDLMSQGGLRVLGVARAKIQSQKLPKKQHDFEFKFVGLVGLADPIRQGVPQAIQECKTAGIRVLMMTGDHPSTAKSIGQKIGLQNTDKVITGSDLNQMTDSVLQAAVQEVSIFSRVAPHQKLRLVDALKKNGEIVAMTGDGVNDAPALKNAHIGIAMGGRGTDVARESASLVLLDDDFASIVEAIRMGRRIYSNLQSAFVYLLAIHVPIAGMSVFPVLLKLPLILLPIHIAFLHLIIEPTCSIAFEAEPENSNILKIPPRNPKDPLFSKKMFLPGLFQGVSILIAILLVYMISLYRGQGEEDGRAIAFTSLIISNLVLIFTSRTSSASIAFKKNHTFLWIVLFAITILVMVLYIPSLRELFRFATLHITDLVICFSVGVVSVVWMRGMRSIKEHIV